MNRLYGVIIVILTVFAVFTLLRSFGVFEFKRGEIKADENLRKSKKEQKKRKFEHWKLDLYQSVTDLLPFLLSDRGRESQEYWIQRLDIKSKILNRKLTAEEVRGKNILLLIIGILCLPLSLYITSLVGITAITAFNFFIYPSRFRAKVREEDDLIDIYFCNLFLLMYAQLRKGSRGKLADVVLAYSNSLKNMGEGNKESIIMGKFTDYLLSNLTMYSDEIAVTKLRNRYMSATIVNFANLAAQSLQGVDNYETLLSFRLELIRKKTESMRKRSEKMKKFAQFAIYGVYIILIKYVVLSMVAKFPSGLKLPF